MTPQLVIETYLPLIKQRCRKINRRGADDLVQDICLKILTLCPESMAKLLKNPGAYITRMVTNQNLDVIKNKKTHEKYKAQSLYISDISEPEADIDPPAAITPVACLTHLETMIWAVYINHPSYQAFSRATGIKLHSTKRMIDGLEKKLNTNKIKLIA